MVLDEVKVTRAIAESYLESFLSVTDVDVALVGAGPANLVAAKRLAEADVKTVLFEKRLSVGGGLWGGGMMFPMIVVQQEACRILDECRIWYHEHGEGYFIADAIETVAKLTAGAIDAGAKIINLVTAEDVMIREEDRVVGLVINWTAAEMAGVHVDPLCVRAKFVIDGTGHEAAICRIVQKKVPGAIIGAEGIKGEKSMWAEVGERTVVEFTQEVHPGLVVAGMAAATVFGGPRMGPIFGGMLLSGEKAARLVLENLGI
ncbi:MAG: thiazole biosynthesis protein [Methanothrix sp.]|nr:thiazole biosynthesis protein [Methanothrix sp.]